MPNKNLSEKLFKPKFNQPETSTLMRRLSDMPQTESSDGRSSHWYRSFNKAMWLWQGIPYLDITDALSRIAISTHSRSNPQYLDTVAGYNSGNWNYEWSKQAMVWQRKALETPENNALLAGQRWLNAANLFSIASYPHLRGDQLAEQSELLANRAFDEACLRLPHERKLIEFPVEGGRVTGVLYLPTALGGPYPTVFFCGSLGHLQSDYFQLFQRYLAPAGYAMLCIDFPSVGYSSKWKLSYDCSKLHQQVLQQLATVPWVDHHNVVALGMLFGANIAVRLAYLEPSRLKGVVSWDGLVHHMMVDDKAHFKIDEMYKDVLASRLGMNNVPDSLLAAEMTRYSLKVQGLLGRRTAVPMLAMCTDQTVYGVKDDAQLIASSSSHGKLMQVNKRPLRNHINTSLKNMMDWIAKVID